MQQIAVDLTPLLPGGDNGGAKIMTLNLIKKISELSSCYQFILIANNKNHAELDKLKSKNIQIINIDLFNIKNPFAKLLFHTTNMLVSALTSALFSITQWQRIKRLSIKWQSKIINNYKTMRLSKTFPTIDLLFTPFTAPFFHKLNVPIVSVVYDLQYHFYPYFFSSVDCYQRKKNFDNTCKYSTKIITISDYVKKTVIDIGKISPDKVQTIHIKLSKRLPTPDEESINKILQSLNLAKNQYLLFPANFWAHKNHKMLFTAFGIHRHANPDSNLKLVCTGANEQERTALIAYANQMGLGSHIIMPGYLSDEEFSALLSSSLAIIFPSLYEGFGMPVLEAMAAGKPVLCSNVTSLPEVAGSAALLFDPRNPTDIAHAINRIENEPELVQNLIKKGLDHAANFGTEEDMAREYLKVFDEILLKKA